MNKQVSQLNPAIRKILHSISITATYALLFGVLSLLQEYTIGLIPGLNKLQLMGIPVEPVFIVAFSIFIIVKYFEVSSPYE